MPQVIKKENLTISIREYTDSQGQSKKVWKTIGELVTWQGDDGSQYQSFEMWGPTGSTQGKVFSQDNNNQQAPQNNQWAQPQQAPVQQAPNSYAQAQQAPQQNFNQPQR